MRPDFSEQVRRLTPAQARLEAARCLSCEDAACTAACPAGVDAMRFIRAIRFRNERRALDVIRRSNVLAGTCGTICPHENLCEGACSARGLRDAPVAIGALQRYAADAADRFPPLPAPRAAATGRRVAVVGAGPAGLGAAAALAQAGVTPVLFEARSRAGGMVNYGVPRFRCADAVVERDLAYVLGLGVELHTGEAPKELSELLRHHDAVLLACGLGRGRPAGLPGEDLAGVWPGMAFIEEVNRDPATAADRLVVGERVVVLGAGQVGMDLAEHALRLGAGAVECTSRRGTEDLRRAAPGELDSALRHGVTFLCCAVPDALEGRDGRVDAVRGHRVRWIGAGPESRMEDLPGSEFRLPASTVLVAAGQAPEDWTLPLLAGLPLRGGQVVADGTGAVNGLPGVWVAGDLRHGGGGTVVASVAQGRDTAREILAVFGLGGAR
ncbi:MAG: FAD-dependent oxidoreductase [Deltaproteobacteria bacterium]|nr:FAD-dependent oxidoreductase [Deltaproteobacteria bacterium]